MDRNEFLPVIFLLFLVVNVSGGSVAGKFRKLADAEPKEDSTATKVVLKTILWLELLILKWNNDCDSET